MNQQNKLVKQHLNFYQGERREANKERITTPGSQYLIQLLKGGFLGDEYRSGIGKTALDVGCGSGFNCITLARLGYTVSGCEIAPEIVEEAKQNLHAYSCEGDIDLGFNENLPYDDCTFDLLISMNVIHYTASQEGVEKTIAEYARVLKPGARLFLTTNHPCNWILKRACHKGDNVFLASAHSDYRNNLLLYVFPDAKDLQKAFGHHFGKIITGENRFDYFSKVVRNFILTGVRKVR